MHIATTNLPADRRGAGETVPMAGKFAAYSPPVLMLLMYPSRHAIAQSGAKPNPGGDGTGDFD
jgi:hypothetical protein